MSKTQPDPPKPDFKPIPKPDYKPIVNPPADFDRKPPEPTKPPVVVDPKLDESSDAKEQKDAHADAKPSGTTDAQDHTGTASQGSDATMPATAASIAAATTDPATAPQKFYETVRFGDIDVQKNFLEQLNATVGSDMDTPDREEHGYRFWVRQFIPSASSDTLAAIALAWPYPRSHNTSKGPFFMAILADEPQPKRYEMGDHFDLTHAPSTFDLVGKDGEANIEKALQLKANTINKLVDYVKETTAKTAPDAATTEPVIGSTAQTDDKGRSV